MRHIGNKVKTQIWSEAIKPTLTELEIFEARSIPFDFRLYGPNTETKWFSEGRRLAPILNTEPRQSVYIELANRMAELAKLHNASLPTYSEYKGK